MTAAYSSPAQGWSARARYLPVGLAAAIVHALIMIPGYNEDGSFMTSEWVVMTLISLAVAAALFLFVVPAGGGMTSLVLAILAVLGIIVFWAMLTLPLAAAAVVVGARERRADGARTQANLGYWIGLVAIVLLIAVVIGDALA